MYCLLWLYLNSNSFIIAENIWTRNNIASIEFTYHYNGNSLYCYVWNFIANKNVHFGLKFNFTWRIYIILWPMIMLYPTSLPDCEYLFLHGSILLLYKHWNVFVHELRSLLQDRLRELLLYFKICNLNFPCWNFLPTPISTDLFNALKTILQTYSVGICIAFGTGWNSRVNIWLENHDTGGGPNRTKNILNIQWNRS